jgi:hypothetical protein
MCYSEQDRDDLDEGCRYDECDEYGVGLGRTVYVPMNEWNAFNYVIYESLVGNLMVGWHAEATEGRKVTDGRSETRVAYRFGR